MALQRMEEQGQGQSPRSEGLSRLATFLLLAGFYLVLPWYLIDLGTRHIAFLMGENARHRAETRLNDALDRLERHKNPEEFYHRVLTGLFRRGEASASPQAFFRRAIPRFKKSFGPHFGFVLWDKNGNPLPGLCDVQGFSYALRQVWQGFRAVALDSGAGVAGRLGGIPELSLSKIRQMQAILGDVLVRDHLFWPYRKDQNPAIVLGGWKEARAYFWFRVSGRFGMLVFIDRKAIAENLGLEKAAFLLNAVNKDEARVGVLPVLKSGMDHSGLFPPGDALFRRALDQFRRRHRSFYEGEDAFLLMRQLDGRHIGYARLSRDPDRRELARVEWLGIMAQGCYLVPFLLYFLLDAVGRRKPFFSLRYRLGFLFLFSCGVPLSGMFLVGAEYLVQLRISRENEAKVRVERLLTNLDNEFPSRFSPAQALMKSVTPGVKSTLDGPGGASDRILRQAMEGLRGLGSDFTFLLSVDARLVHIDRPGSGAGNSVYAEFLAAQVLDFFNRGAGKPSVAGRLGTIPPGNFFPDSVFFETFLAGEGTILPWGFGTTSLFILYELIRDVGTGGFPHILFSVWKAGNLEKRYLGPALGVLRRNALGIRFFARDSGGSWVYPEVPPRDFPRLARVFAGVAATNGVFSERLSWQGKPYLAVGVEGKKLSGFSLLGLFPLVHVEREIAQARKSFAFFCLLSLFLTLALGMGLVSSFLAPVAVLSRTAESLRRRRFSCFIPELANDEFGDLGKVFRQTLEGLKELEVARIVQENLFPDGPLAGKEFTLFGRAISMGDLGGDYVDYFRVAPDALAGMIGDVTGHGVPAALFMGVAKAGILGSPAEQQQPAAILSRLNTLFIALNQTPMVTCSSLLYFRVVEETGVVTIANAGHNYPLLVDGETGLTREIEIPGRILGVIPSRMPFLEVQVPILPGDTLVCFTDGFFEAQGFDGKPLGYPRWRELVEKAWHWDPQTFYCNLLREHAKVCPEERINDDRTILIVSRSGRNSGHPVADTGFGEGQA